ncbi:HigA family addiction module antitoxin [Phenylobacterium sp.]|uniref:HigA family addiction module antitoxin n=1 Tax=Phenylobacterium sp. TaxID=1871053 RepID=UPI0035ADD5DD
MTMKYVSLDPPGSYIKEELEARGWTQRDLGYVLNMGEQQLSRILSGQHAITPDMARALGDAFDVPADFFANLQKQYDLSRAKEPDPGIRTRASLQTIYPVREMIKRGWIEDAEPSLLQLQIARFFEVESVDEAPRYAMAAKKTHYDNDPPAQVVWLYRVRQLARQLDAPPFSREKLCAVLPRMRPMMIDPEAVKEVPNLLLECGVRLVVVEWLPGSKIDGVCTWLDDDRPVIGLSTLHDRLDNFWFVLRHEIEHILNGDGMVHAMFDTDEELSNSVAAEEQRANEAAREFCIPYTRLRSFHDRKFPYISERDVVNFAAVQEVHPAIVVGQLQHLMKRHNWLRKFQVPVRRYLVETAFSDGWGQIAPANL